MSRLSAAAVGAHGKSAHRPAVGSDHTIGAPRCNLRALAGGRRPEGPFHFFFRSHNQRRTTDNGQLTTTYTAKNADAFEGVTINACPLRRGHKLWQFDAAMSNWRKSWGRSELSVRSKHVITGFDVVFSEQLPPSALAPLGQPSPSH